MQLFFFMKIETKTAAYETTQRKLNVYEFVTTSFSTQMNDNLLEPTCTYTQTCKMSDQQHFLIICRSLYLICEQDSISLPTNKHLHPRAIKERKVWGGYFSHIALFIITSSSLVSYLCSHFCVNLHATRWHTHKKKLRKWILSPYLSSCPLLKFPV